MPCSRIVIAIAAIFAIVSGPFHGAIFGYNRKGDKNPSPNIRRGRRLGKGMDRYGEPGPEVDLMKYKDSDSKSYQARATETIRAEVPVLERPGSCGQAVHGNMTIDTRDNLLDLPLNELLIKLEKPPFVTTPNPYGQTVVDIGLYVYEIAHIDPAENTYVMEGFVDLGERIVLPEQSSLFFLDNSRKPGYPHYALTVKFFSLSCRKSLVWCDPRLRFEFNESDPFDQRTHVFLEKDAERELEHIWWPTLFFVNEVMPRRIENEEVIIYSDGTVEYREKFGVELSTNYDMTKFPFDTQILIAEIESFAWTSKDMIFHLEEDLVGFSSEFEVPEFNIEKVEEHLEVRMEPRDRYSFSELVAEVYVRRDPNYYITKVIIPLGLIVCISWAVFWMDGEDLADRMAISFTGVLTSVAYQFIVAESLPRHIYNTFLDNFVLISFVMMALTIIENIGVSMLLKQEKKEKEERLVRMESRLIQMETSNSSLGHPGDRIRTLTEPTIQEDEPVMQEEENREGEKGDRGQVPVHRRNKYLTMLYECVNPPGTGKEKAQHLDKVCRYVFPVFYATSVSILAAVQVVN